MVAPDIVLEGPEAVKACRIGKPLRGVIIHNRTAGHAVKREEQFLAALSVFSEARWNLAVEMTSREGHAADLAREAAEAGAEVVIAAGGDGTINEVLQGIAHTQAALACLPLGTVNVWSREIGYSSNAREAARQIVSGSLLPLDLGCANGRYFLLMAGIGLDAEVTAAIGNPTKKQRLGIAPYIIETLKIAPRFRGSQVDIDVDGQTTQHSALMVLISNTRLYGGFARPSRQAIANDGLLDVRVFAGRNALHTVMHVAPFLRGTGAGGSRSPLFKGRRISVCARPPMRVQVDGDSIGNTPIVIEAQPAALWAIVPNTYSRELVRT